MVCMPLDQAVWVRALARTLHFVLEQDTLLSQCFSPCGCINRYQQILSIPQEGSRNTTSPFMLLKLEISTVLMGHLACIQVLPVLF